MLLQNLEQQRYEHVTLTNDHRMLIGIHEKTVDELKTTAKTLSDTKYMKDAFDTLNRDWEVLMADHEALRKNHSQLITDHLKIRNDLQSASARLAEIASTQQRFVELDKIHQELIQRHNDLESLYEQTCVELAQAMIESKKRDFEG